MPPTEPPSPHLAKIPVDEDDGLALPMVLSHESPPLVSGPPPDPTK
jgi:hypothetical protein